MIRSASDSRPIMRVWFVALCLGVAVNQGGCTGGGNYPLPPPGSPSALPDNVVLVTIDTLRADHVGCYGNHTVQTPTLDALAARGTRFAQAVTAVPLTLPSHTSIMTGTYPHFHGVRDMGGFVLGESPPTLATLLAQAGFETAGFVGSFTLDHQFGINRGFQTYDDRMPAADPSSPGHEPEIRAEVVVERALAWLGGRPHGRFFLWVHFFDPHHPYDPPEPFRTQYARQPYDSEIAYTDGQLSRLMNALDGRGLRDKTLSVVLGDHGESLGEHGESTHGIFLYDAAVRIPLIMSGPGVPAGKIIDAQVRSVDVAPTILSTLNLESGSLMQGVSLWPLMRGQGQLPAESRFAYLETIYPRTHMGWSPIWGLRSGEWKLIVAPQPELYDLQHDPGENQSVLKSNPSVADRYQAVLAGIQKVAGKAAPASPVSRETQQELASLGYISAGTGTPVKLDLTRPDPKSRIGLLGDFEKSINLMNAREYARAAALLQRLVARDPSNPLFALRLGICQELLGDRQKAIAAYEGAIHHQAETDEILYRAGNLLMEGGRFQQAVPMFERSLRLNPSQQQSLNNLAICFFNLGNMDATEKTLSRLLTVDPRSASGHNSLGLVRIRQGRREEAAAQFQAAVNSDPQFWEGWLNLGLYYHERGRREDALACFERFSKGAPPLRFADALAQVRVLITQLRAGGR